MIGLRNVQVQHGMAYSRRNDQRDCLVRLIAEQSATGRGSIKTLAILTDEQNHVGRVLGEETVARLALLEPPLGVDVSLNVASDRMDDADAAVAVDQGAIGPGEPSSPPPGVTIWFAISTFSRVAQTRRRCSTVAARWLSGTKSSRLMPINTSARRRKNETEAL